MGFLFVRFQLVKRFHMLEDRTMDLMLTLTPIFDKYVTAEVQNMQQTIFPTGNVLISEVGFMKPFALTAFENFGTVYPT